MPTDTVCSSPKMSGKTMLKTYREIAIEQMIVTVEEAMSQVLGDLPPSMKEAVEQFRTRLGAAIDSVEFEKRHSTGVYMKLTTGKALPDICCSATFKAVNPRQELHA